MTVSVGESRPRAQAGRRPPTVFGPWPRCAKGPVPIIFSAALLLLVRYDDRPADCWTHALSSFVFVALLRAGAQAGR